jgi:hypothetical protein
MMMTVIAVSRRMMRPSRLKAEKMWTSSAAAS